MNELKKANADYTITELCRILEVSMSSYYYEPVKPDEQEQVLLDLIESIAEDSGNTYGRRRIHAELNARDHTIGVYKTASLMNKLNIHAIAPKKKHYYPNSGDEHHYAQNLLKRQFNPDTLNTHWVGDITYIRNQQGWSYLACVLDLSTKEIVGYALSKSPNAELAKAALNNAIKRQQPVLNQLLFHSDQGCQYSAATFRERLSQLTITQSMSRRGNCWDNAVMERFF